MKLVETLNKHPIIFIITLLSSIVTIYTFMSSNSSDAENIITKTQNSPTLLCDANSAYKVEVTSYVTKRGDSKIGKSIVDSLDNWCFKIKEEPEFGGTDSITILYTPEAKKKAYEIQEYVLSSLPKDIDKNLLKIDIAEDHPPAYPDVYKNPGKWVWVWLNTEKIHAMTQQNN